MTDADITENMAKLRERVRIAARSSGREAGAVAVLAAGKAQSAGAIRAAAAAGIAEIGENYLQEALEKIERLRDLPLTWHFIGPVQSNKTRRIAAHFDWVHSVDRAKIARRLSAQRPPELAPLNVCLQVNIGGESGKSGVAPASLAALADEVAALPRLKLRGLMAIPAPSGSEREQRAAFGAVRECLDLLRGSHPELDTLSMGMSADLEAAIAEGSTLVRVGTAVFGPRRG